MPRIPFAPYVPNPDPESMKKVQKIWDWYFNMIEKTGQHDQHDYRLMKDLKLIDARPEGRAVWALKIPMYLCNSHRHLHGGAAALIFDMCTMSALGPLHEEGGWNFLGGLSRSLNVSYIRGCEIGTDVIIDCYVIQAGRTMGFIRGDIKSPDGSIIYASTEHHKVNYGPSEEMMMYEPKYEENTEVKPKL